MLYSIRAVSVLVVVVAVARSFLERHFLKEEGDNTVKFVGDTRKEDTDKNN